MGGKKRDYSPEMEDDAKRHVLRTTKNKTFYGFLAKRSDTFKAPYMHIEFPDGKYGVPTIVHNMDLNQAFANMFGATKYVMVQDTPTNDLSMLLKREIFKFPIDVSVDRPFVYDVASIMKANGLAPSVVADDGSSEEDEPPKPKKTPKSATGVKKQSKTSTQNKPKMITLTQKKK